MFKKVKYYIAAALLGSMLFSANSMADDNFGDYRRGLESPVEKILTVTPDDDNDLTFIPRGIFVKTTGIVAVEMKDGTQISFANGEIATGVWHPMRPARILETTTATVLIGE